MEQKDAQRGLDQLRQKVQRVSQSITRFMVRAGVAVTALGAAFIAISRSIIQTASSFEMMEIKLDALTKGKGAETLERLNKWALTMPVNTQKAIDTFVLMKAMGLDPTIKSMEILVDVASVFGEEAMPRVARALGQMQTLGKISAEELNQMAEVGINARKYLTAAFGKTVEELQKSGVNINKVVKAIMDGMKEEFGGSSRMAMSTWQGMTTTLVSYWTEFKLSIARAGVFEMFKEDLRGVLDWIERLIKEGKFKEWAQGVSDALKGVHDRVKEWVLDSGPGYLESLKKVAGVVGSLSVIVGKLALTIASSRVLVIGFLTAFIGLIAAGPVFAFASALTTLGVTIGSIIGVLETLALFVMINPIVLAILGIGVAAIGGYALYKHLTTTREHLDEVREALEAIPSQKDIKIVITEERLVAAKAEIVKGMEEGRFARTAAGYEATLGEVAIREQVTAMFEDIAEKEYEKAFIGPRLPIAGAMPAVATPVERMPQIVRPTVGTPWEGGLLSPEQIEAIADVEERVSQWDMIAQARIETYQEEMEMIKEMGDVKSNQFDIGREFADQEKILQDEKLERIRIEKLQTIEMVSVVQSAVVGMYQGIAQASEKFFRGDLKNAQQWGAAYEMIGRSVSASMIQSIGDTLSAKAIDWTAEGFAALGKSLGWNPFTAGAGAASYFKAAALAGVGAGLAYGAAGAIRGAGEEHYAGAFGGEGVSAGVGGAERGGRREYGAAVRATPQNIFIQPSVTIEGDTIIIGRTGVEELKETMGAAVVEATKDALETGEIDLRQYE